MGSKWVLVLVIFMFVSLQGCLSQISGCWEEERVALLQLKHFFNDPNSLQDWVEGDQHNNSDCCQWGRVYCNESTEVLDLSWNFIPGFVDNGGLDKPSRLTNLESLDLTYNMFNNDILSSINALPSLKYLNLSGNRLNETIDLQGLDSCKNLTDLDLSRNRIEKVVFPKGLDSLRNLEDLNMGYNPIEKFISPKGSTGLRKLKTLYLYGLNVINGSSLLQSLGSFLSLKTLYLRGSFSDSTTNRDYLHNLTNVEELILDESFLYISLLQSIAAFTSLKHLSISGCQIYGILGFQDLPNFKNLTHMNMSSSSLDINVLQIIGKMTSLEFLSLSNGGLQGTLFHQG
ncbi:hypothetical protein Dsin_004303 [Dipteronia sinensis]|uniref:Leucine-rich repeat-containing N-terminal plant-type domain-containing protein n=1 Tax=Dipteronia sinensis TaxID=43782 RepID=A0AAE0BAS0_9ROSI|nr:hypothetical protein Dsin_004303 [Dipteronia sinensis]